jgi:hypothetical protein
MIRLDAKRDEAKELQLDMQRSEEERKVLGEQVKYMTTKFEDWKAILETYEQSSNVDVARNQQQIAREHLHSVLQGLDPAYLNDDTAENPEYQPCEITLEKTLSDWLDCTYNSLVAKKHRKPEELKTVKEQVHKALTAHVLNGTECQKELLMPCGTEADPAECLDVAWEDIPAAFTFREWANALDEAQDALGDISESFVKTMSKLKGETGQGTVYHDKQGDEDEDNLEADARKIVHNPGKKEKKGQTYYYYYEGAEATGGMGGVHYHYGPGGIDDKLGVDDKEVDPELFSNPSTGGLEGAVKLMKSLFSAIIKIATIPSPNDKMHSSFAAGLRKQLVGYEKEGCDKATEGGKCRVPGRIDKTDLALTRKHYNGLNDVCTGVAAVTILECEDLVDHPWPKFIDMLGVTEQTVTEQGMPTDGKQQESIAQKRGAFDFLYAENETSYLSFAGGGQMLSITHEISLATSIDLTVNFAADGGESKEKGFEAGLTLGPVHARFVFQISHELYQQV